jgi:hypothetical protein
LALFLSSRAYLALGLGVLKMFCVLLARLLKSENASLDLDSSSRDEVNVTVYIVA